MKDASRAWQKHFKHPVLGFSLWAPREKALFPSLWALPHISHRPSLSTWAYKSNSSLPLGHRGFLPACPWCGHFLLVTHTEMGEVLLLTHHFLPSGSRVPLPPPHWGSMKPSQTSHLHLLPEILFQKQRFSLGKTPREFKEDPWAFCIHYCPLPSLYLLWSPVPAPLSLPLN